MSEMPWCKGQKHAQITSCRMANCFFGKKKEDQSEISDQPDILIRFSVQDKNSRDHPGPPHINPLASSELT